MSSEPRENATIAEQLEADIERQREELATTVDALQARLDVKARARHKVEEVRDRATDDQGRPTPQVVAVAAAVLVAAVGLVVLRRHRH